MWSRCGAARWQRCGVPHCKAPILGRPSTPRNRVLIVPAATRRSSSARSTYYDVLGLEASASQDEIKTAFRRQAKLLHPDVSKSEDSEEEFKQLKEAYDTLSDERQRAQYDAALRMGIRPGPGGGGGDTPFPGGGAGQHVVIINGQPFVVSADDGGLGAWAAAAFGMGFDGEDGFFVQEEDSDGDDDDDDGGGELDGEDLLEFMQWATTGGNVRSSFQSSWQANGRKARRAQQRARRGGGGGGETLTQEEKELLLAELPRPARLAAQRVFGPRLQSMDSIEELGELLEAMEEMEAVGIEFDMPGVDGLNGGGGGGFAGQRRRRTAGGGGGGAGRSRRTGGGGGSSGRRRR